MKRPLQKIRYFVSGHGYGHGTRSSLIINTLRHMAPDVQIDIVSSLAPSFVRHQLEGTIRQHRRTLDVGILQSDSLTALSLHDTLMSCRQLLHRQPHIVASERDRLVQDNVALVVSDIPWIPCLAAAQAGVPAVGVSNFGWDLIYQSLAAKAADFSAIAAAAAEGYETACLLQLPFGPDRTSFARTEPMPLVARHAHLSRQEVRRRLGIAPERKVALIAFGGFGLDIAYEKLAALHDWTFIATTAIPSPPANLLLVQDRLWYYPDLLRSADVVVTKPGYGIVSEAIANDCAVLFTRRHYFSEEDYLVAGLLRYCRAWEIDETTLRQGEWEEGLNALWGMPRAAETLASNGAEVVAARLLTMMRERR